MQAPLSFHTVFPWTKAPFIVSAPMRPISFAPLAVAVSRAGGLGFLAGGTDLVFLETSLEDAVESLSKFPIPSSSADLLPIGVGFINWAVDLDKAISIIQNFMPSAVWFFAPRNNVDLIRWTERTREVTSMRTEVWIQVGSVADAVEVAQSCHPDVLVVQGSDAGGHGIARGAGIISLLPEVADALAQEGLGNIRLLAAGGIVEGRAVAACLALGADGVALGTRFLASEEATLTKGNQGDVIRSKDGGTSTARTTVYDILRGATGWPEHYNARGIINQSYLDAKDGIVTEENKRLYAEALEKGDQGWGEHGRLAAYAGTGVGLISEVLPARDILNEIRHDVKKAQLKFTSMEFD